MTDDVYQSSKMRHPKGGPLAHYRRQLRIQDIEPHGFLDTLPPVSGRGKYYSEPVYTFYTDKMQHMDKDWLTYLPTGDPAFVPRTV